MSSVAPGILATWTWGHCPPVLADSSCERQAADQCGTVSGGRAFPFNSEAMGRVARMLNESSTSSLSAESGVSTLAAAIVGRVATTLYNRHLSTDLCTAAATSAGDILNRSSDSPVSSRKLADEAQSQPMRHNVAINAPTGPERRLTKPNGHEHARRRACRGYC